MPRIFNIYLPYYEGPCLLVFGTYALDKSTSLHLASIWNPDAVDPDDRYSEPVATCTVCLADANLAPGEVAIKSWSENEGMDRELQRLGVIGPAKRWAPAGYAAASIHDLLVKEE